VDSGDVCFDKTSGFWLVHSVPHFPPPPSFGYSYPESGTVFGQTFLCVTYQYSTLNDIGTILRPYRVCLYEMKLRHFFSSHLIVLPVDQWEEQNILEVHFWGLRSNVE